MHVVIVLRVRHRRLLVQRLIVVLMVVATDDRPAARRVRVATVILMIGTGR